MVKGRVAPPKCLFHVATQTEKIDMHVLIEQSYNTFSLVKIGL